MPLPLQASRLDRRIWLQRATTTQNPETGAEIHAFADWKQKWAQRRGLKGAEAFAAQQLVAEAMCEYVVRDDPDTRTVTPHETYRLRDGSRLYDIVGVEPSERRGESIVLRVKGRAEVAA